MPGSMLFAAPTWPSNILCCVAIAASLLAAQSQPSNDKCKLAPEPGYGKELRTRWYFSSADSTCKTFNWTGSGGNGNRFASASDCATECCICTLEYEPQCGVDGVTYGNLCAIKCAGVELAYAGECGPCELPPSRGGGRQLLPRWYFSAAERTCKPFNWTGSGGNANRFKTRADCSDQCCICTQESNPQCGVDGVTYDNPCAIKCAGVELAHAGECGPCELPPSRGGGRQLLPRWYFSAAERTCKPFNWTGSGGNANRFKTRADCSDKCCICTLEYNPQCGVDGVTYDNPCSIKCIGVKLSHPGECGRCDLPPSRGTGKALLPRWYFSAASRACERFDWGGAGGNSNRFKTKADCAAACACFLPADAGTGKKTEMTYGFLAEAGVCTPFNYTGAGGNNNRFRSAADCSKSCCRQCPFGDPLGRPVCGSDAELYGDACLAQCAGVAPRYCPGKCAEQGMPCFLDPKQSVTALGCCTGLKCYEGPLVYSGQALGTCYNMSEPLPIG